MKHNNKYMDILHNWDIGEISTITENNIGLINKTFLLTNTKDELYVLQCMHSIFNYIECTENYYYVTKHLLEKGLPYQEVIKNKNGELSTLTDNARWRLLKGVKGQVFQICEDIAMAHEVGKALGVFHKNTADFHIPFLRVRPSFQHEDILHALIEQADFFNAHTEYKPLFEEVRDILQNNLVKQDLTTKLIHCDPKITNIIFDENKKSLCLVDLDTTKYLSPLYDLADGMRSLCGLAEDDPNNTFNMDFAQAFLQSFKEQARIATPDSEWPLLPQITSLVIIGLSARFLTDLATDSYFGWDNTKYKSRREHNLARTLGQLSLYKSFNKQKDLLKQE